MAEGQLQAFMSDPDLLNLIEHVKVSDDILDVIDLSETQHSAMLAWCLNPGEGHGQGDAVIKDFLIAAYQAAMANGCTHDTKKFFKRWTPSQVRRSSFGSAFITREFHVELAELGRKGRLDLLMVDPQNKILIAIENKAGASLTQKQLDFYSGTVNQRLGKRAAFRDFDFGFVVLDRNLNDYDDQYLAALGKRWCLLDYGWLETAATRAKQHVARNNQAAQLLMAYCQNLTDWEKPAQKATSEVAAVLAERHKAVVDGLKLLRSSTINEWTPTTLNEDDLCMFFHQNRQLCRELISASGIPGMVGNLQRVVGKNTLIEKNGPTRLSLSTAAMRAYQKPGKNWWPMYLHIKKRDKADPDAPFAYDLRFIVRNDAFAKKPGPIAVRSALNELLPGLSTFPECNHRRITIKTGLSGERATALAAEWTAKVDRLLMGLQAA